jgi:hypothetical protein
MGARRLLPSFKRLTTNHAIVGGSRVAMASPKKITDVNVSRQEPLGLLR